MAIVFAGNDAGYIALTAAFPSTGSSWYLFGVKPASPMPERFQAIMVLAAWSGPGSPTAHVLGITTEGKWQLNTNFGTGASGTFPDGMGAPIGTVEPAEWNLVAVRMAGSTAELVEINLATETLTKTSIGQVQFTPTRCTVGANSAEAFEGKIAPIRWGSGSLSDAQLLAQAKSLVAVAGQGTVVGNKSGLGANLAAILEGEAGGTFSVNEGGEAYVTADADAPQYAEPGGPGGAEGGDNVFELGGELDLRPQATIDSTSTSGLSVTASGIAASYDPAASVIAQLINATTGNVVSGVALETTVEGDGWSASAGSVPEGTYRVRLVVADKIGSVTQESANFTVIDPVTQPGAPTLAEPTVLGPYAIKLEWTLADATEQEVRVYRKTSPGGSRTLMASLPPGSTEYTASGLSAGTTYYFDIGAWNTAGETRSNEKSAATMASSVAATLSVTPTALAQPGTVTATLSNPPGSALVSAAFYADGDLVASVTQSPFSVQIPLDEEDNGQVVISATGVDALTRNVTSSPIIVTVSIDIPDPEEPEEPEDGELTDQQILDLLANPIDPKYQDEAFPYGFDFRADLQSGETIQAVDYIAVQVRGPDELDPEAPDMLEGDPILRPALGVVVQRVKAGKPGLAYYLRCKVLTSLEREIVSELAIRVHATTGRRAVRL